MKKKQTRKFLHFAHYLPKDIELTLDLRQHKLEYEAMEA